MFTPSCAFARNFRLNSTSFLATFVTPTVYPFSSAFSCKLQMLLRKCPIDTIIIVIISSLPNSEHNAEPLICLAFSVPSASLLQAIYLCSGRDMRSRLVSTIHPRQIFTFFRSPSDLFLLSTMKPCLCKWVQYCSWLYGQLHQ